MKYRAYKSYRFVSIEGFQRLFSQFDSGRLSFHFKFEKAARRADVNRMRSSSPPHGALLCTKKIRRANVGAKLSIVFRLSTCQIALVLI